MPSVAQNYSTWDVGYRWPQRGDEWSSPWNGLFRKFDGAQGARCSSWVAKGSTRR